MSTEADTCRKYVLPNLYGAGWTDDQIIEQTYFTDGRILVFGDQHRRRPGKKADYILKYRPDFAIAVVEAKADYKKPGDGLQQAKEYAEILGLKFAYSTNGGGIVEHDYLTGLDTDRQTYPRPEELWKRLRDTEGSLAEEDTERLLASTYHLPGKSLRYYEENAVNIAVEAILQGKRRVLLTMATGTGKTIVAFQIAWKLWNTRWNRSGDHRRPRILFLADRNILVDDPKDKVFTPFGDARWKIQGEAVKSREMYFATYQAIAKDINRPGLFHEYPPDFFDLVIVDECHRGSARDESNWREILEYFSPAFQLGMTATPLREDNRDTYRYFGNPVYTYTLSQGIEDGFLAPYKVHRVLTTADAAGWRPSKGETDRYGRLIPDEEYRTEDFERVIALRARNTAIARHLTDFLKSTDRFAKTIVFCVDQEHAEEMRKALNNFNADLAREHPDYVCRVVSDEGDIGRGHLGRFQDLETIVPTIVTTSKLLTTGVDVPTCKNVVLVRVINSMTEFKQIIGRGTRVRDDYGKWSFNILDYTGSATRLFADPEFDGEPAWVGESSIDDGGRPLGEGERVIRESAKPEDVGEALEVRGDATQRRKYYVDRGSIEIAAHLVYELDPSGKQVRVVKFTDYTADSVRSMYSSAADLRSEWGNADQRAAVISSLESRGISFQELAEAAGQADADPFDLLCYVAFNAPLRTRRERADRLRHDHKDFFDHYAPIARLVLEEILAKYVEHGVAQFKVPEILKIPPISGHGNVIEISQAFGGPEQLREALSQMQALLYNSG